MNYDYVYEKVRPYRQELQEVADVMERLFGNAPGGVVSDVLLAKRHLEHSGGTGSEPRAAVVAAMNRLKSVVETLNLFSPDSPIVARLWDVHCTIGMVIAYPPKEAVANG